MKLTYDMDFEVVMKLEVDGVLECVASEDFAEGLRSLGEKRAGVQGTMVWSPKLVAEAVC